MDESEEEKLVKIQIEQIKNSCRHMYNYYNQLVNLENELVKSPYGSMTDAKKVRPKRFPSILVRSLDFLVVEPNTESYDHHPKKRVQINPDVHAKLSISS
jgi:hypothetical protein